MDVLSQVVRPPEETAAASTDTINGGAPMQATTSIGSKSANPTEDVKPSIADLSASNGNDEGKGRETTNGPPILAGVSRTCVPHPLSIRISSLTT